MIINPGPAMGYSELVELYGEEMGFSLGKTLRKAGSAVKSAAKVVARNPAAIATGGASLLAPKSVQKSVNSVTRIASTGGASLLVSKQDRNTASKAGKVTVSAAKVVARNPAAFATGGASLLAPKSIQKKLNSTTRIASTGGASLLVSKRDRNTASKIARPVAHVAAQVGRNPLVKKAAGTALRATAAYYTGGASELALQANKLKSKARALAKPLAAKSIPLSSAVRSAVGSFGMRRPDGSGSTPAAAVAAAMDDGIPPASKSLLIPIALGGLGLLGVLYMSSHKK